MDSPDKRLFRRIAFDCPASIRQGDQTWEATTVDLSLHGILLDSQAHDLDPEQEVVVDVHLNDETKISMQCELRHQNQQRFGFCCCYIDLESITHLRKLLELNLGEPSLLERELQQLA